MPSHGGGSKQIEVAHQVIRIKPDKQLDRYGVYDGGQRAFALEVEDTEWRIYGPVRHDKSPLLQLDLHGLFYPLAVNVEQQGRELEQLETRWDDSDDFRRLLDYVGQVIQYFYADRAEAMGGEDGWILAARGVKLCQLFLSFLDSGRDPVRAERYHAAQLVLQRAYYFNLAFLYEVEEGRTSSQPEIELLKLYPDGWVTREYRATLRTWHGAILREENRWLFHDLLGTEREDEIWSLLVRGDDDAQLRCFFREEAGHRFVEYLIKRWFLPRYDLVRAQVLQYTVDQSRAGDDTTTIEQSPWRSRLWPWGGIGLGIVFFALSLPSGFGSWEWAQIVVALVVIGAWLLLVLSVIGTGLGKPIWLRFQLPSLLAAVFVGYFPLLLADEPWVFAISLSDAGLLRPPYLLRGAFTFIGFAVFIAGLSLAYLLSRIRVVDMPEDAVKKRACRLLVWGLSYSFVVGVAAVDAMGGRLFDLSSAQSNLRIQGPFVVTRELTGLTGWIYPSVVWVFMWLALFVGLFVQVLWEERPITEPWQ